MKNILMITPFFAPHSHAAVYRAHKFAKYLPRFAWKPCILTVDRSFLYFTDNALLDDLPQEAEIIRAKHIDLTYSGIKSVFEKPTSDGRLIKRPTSSGLIAKLQEGKKNLLRSIIDKFRKETLFLPDRYITWYPFALKKAKEIINSKYIDIIYSSAPPFTSHLIAMKLKRLSKIPWIADFRDLIIEDERPGVRPAGLRYRISRIIEKKIMKEADLVLTTCEGAKSLLLAKYAGIVNNKIICIRTGTDAEIWKRANLKEKSKKFTIIFAGEYQRELRRTFFEILKVIFEKKLFERENVEVLIVGSIKRNISLRREIELLGLSDVIRSINYLSLENYFSALLSADATLLPGTFKNKIPIKVADYLFAKKPIITFDANDEVQSILKKSGLGIFIPNEIEEGVNVLLNLLKRNYTFNINEEYIKGFSAFNQTEGLSNILTKLTKKSK